MRFAYINLYTTDDHIQNYSGMTNMRNCVFCLRHLHILYAGCTVALGLALSLAFIGHTHTHIIHVDWHANHMIVTWYSAHVGEIGVMRSETHPPMEWVKRQRKNANSTFIEVWPDDSWLFFLLFRFMVFWLVWEKVKFIQHKDDGETWGNRMCGRDGMVEVEVRPKKLQTDVRNAQMNLKRWWETWRRDGNSVAFSMHFHIPPKTALRTILHSCFHVYSMRTWM